MRTILQFVSVELSTLPSAPFHGYFMPVSLTRSASCARVLAVMGIK